MNKHLYSAKLTDAVAADPDNSLGRLQYEPSGVYRFVKNADTVTLGLGDVCYHKITDTTDLFKNVYQCLTANLSLLAGVVMATAGITTLAFGWVQIFGTNASVSVSGPTTGGTTLAAGDFLKGVNAANYMVRDGASTAQATFDRNVQILQTVATTTTPAAAYVTGFINCF